MRYVKRVQCVPEEYVGVCHGKITAPFATLLSRERERERGYFVAERAQLNTEQSVQHTTKGQMRDRTLSLSPSL